MRAITASAVALLVVGCQAPPQEMTEAEIAQINAEVTQLAETWMAAWNDVDNDCETAIDLLHPDRMISYSGGKRHTPRDEWLEWCAAVTSNRASDTGAWTDRNVRVAGPSPPAPSCMQFARLCG